MEVLRHTVKGDTVVVAPVVPCAALKLSATPKQRKFYLELCRHFATIPALGCCPLLTVPVDQLPCGTPLSLGLFTLHRSDMRLLSVALKMVPLFREMAAQGREEAAKAAAAAQAAAAAAAKDAPPKSKSAKSPANASAAGSAAGASPVDSKKSEKALEKAEKLKEKGNEAFKAGKYTEAVAHYSKAIATYGEKYVYYNNRAMACLKVIGGR